MKHSNEASIYLIELPCSAMHTSHFYSCSFRETHSERHTHILETTFKHSTNSAALSNEIKWTIISLKSSEFCRLHLLKCMSLQLEHFEHTRTHTTGRWRKTVSSSNNGVTHRLVATFQHVSVQTMGEREKEQKNDRNVVTCTETKLERNQKLKSQ